MATWVLRNAEVLLPGGFRSATDVRIGGASIARIGTGLPAGGAEVFDASGCRIVPGFIDLHIHGAAGGMCEDADPAALERLSTFLARRGVTGFLATLGTLSAPRLRAAVETIAAVAGGEPGARILGIHLEGPYLNPRRAGAQVAEWMRAPAIEELDAMQDAAGGRVRLVTVAPELPGALPFIAAARARGVTVAVGHSDATAADTLLGIEAGATHVTHLFNAMRALHHREPGVVGAALGDDRVSVELVCDGHHVAPAVVPLVWRCKPRGTVALVSDAVGAAGMPEGEYDLFGVRCRSAGGAVRRCTDGTLMGSCLSLDGAVRNLHRWLPEVPLEDVLAAASAVPAAVIGDGDRGAIAEGRAADLAVLDAGLNVMMTMCGGVVTWRQ